MSVPGCLGLLTRQVMCEFSQCYNTSNLGFCLWTNNGSQLNFTDAQSACQQRNNSFLPRVTNSDIQSKLREFRSADQQNLSSSNFWIDVKAVSMSAFHWIDGSSLAG